MKISLITNAQAERLTRKSTPEVTILTSRGRSQTHSLGATMRREGIDTSEAAISELDASRLTAEALGVVRFKVYDLLDTANLGLGLSSSEERALISDDNIPDEVQEKVDRILENPPSETIWVADRFIVAGLSLALGLASSDSVPAFSERRIVEI